MSLGGSLLDGGHELMRDLDQVLDVTQEQGFEIFGEVTDDTARGVRNVLSLRP